MLFFVKLPPQYKGVHAPLEYLCLSLRCELRHRFASNSFYNICYIIIIKKEVVIIKFESIYIDKPKDPFKKVKEEEKERPFFSPSLTEAKVDKTRDFIPKLNDADKMESVFKPSLEHSKEPKKASFKPQLEPHAKEKERNFTPDLEISEKQERSFKPELNPSDNPTNSRGKKN